MSMASVVQIIANHGRARSLRLVDASVDAQWDNTQRIPIEEADRIRALLFDAVRIPYEVPMEDRAFFAGASAVLDGTTHLVGGKTGTAEVNDPANALCNESALLCPPMNWYVGFSDAAQRIVIVMNRVHDGKAPCSAASIGGAIFADILHKPMAIPCSELQPVLEEGSGL
jgi:cell division protein FtsI/penicillin-binding protein 2